MSISDDIRKIKEKYTPKDLVLTPSSFCRNEYARSLGQCERCGICGREFDDKGNLIESSKGENEDVLEN